MLAQYHAAGAYDTADEEYDAIPPNRIETEIAGEGKEGTAQTANGCCVGGNLPPDVDEGTNYLYCQSCHHNAAHEMWHVEMLHDIYASKVANDRDGIWYHTSFAVS